MGCATTLADTLHVLRTALLATLLATGACRSTPPGALPAATDPCRDAWACTSFGLCTADGPRCIAAVDASCAASRDCADRGACRALDAFCRPTATTAEDCRALGNDRADWCAEQGRCQVVAGLCAAVTVADCAGSRRCALFGECAPLRGGCVRAAADDADCARPAGTERYVPCATNGQCTAQGGRCVAADDGRCRASEACRRSGQCSAHGGLCVATRQEDCAASLDCEEDGACNLQGSTCGAAEADCARLPRCQAPEGCKLEGGICASPIPFTYFQF